jgi:DNA modification methylase
METVSASAIPRANLSSEVDLAKFVPEQLRRLGDLQSAIPVVARNDALLSLIELAVKEIPTRHVLVHGDARKMSKEKVGKAHLVLTSPPYWTLKKYRDSSGQLGHVVDYDDFVVEVDKVWQRCFDLLVVGGRLVCVVGDVCLSRRKNEGRHTVVPLHATIQEHCRKIGFDNLSPIIWHKIANAAYEVENGGGFLGKPYEPNAVIKNDVEFILMQRKPGGYRTPQDSARILSVISATDYQKWFQQIWKGVTGASTRDHPAPYPVELAERLVRMFSFVGDTVLDPFMGTGTTALAASKWGRNSVNFEIDADYLRFAAKRLEGELSSLFANPVLVMEQE